MRWGMLLSLNICNESSFYFIVVISLASFHSTQEGCRIYMMRITVQQVSIYKMRLLVVLDFSKELENIA